jgi:hypothetical protein
MDPVYEVIPIALSFCLSHIQTNLKAKAILTAMNISNSMVEICNLKSLNSKNIYLQLDFTLEVFCYTAV